MKKRIKSIMAILLVACVLMGCESETTTITHESDTETVEPVTYEAMMYDNQGNNFLNFQGQEFTIAPNKIKQYAWNSDGVWTSYYDTSSVVTIEIDGNYIESCGSTVIFKDTRLKMLDIPEKLNTTKQTDDEQEYTVSIDGNGLETYIGLTNWWYDIKEQGQHGSKIVLIQSQDGYNIGAFVGDDITWEVAEKLPKTTKIMIDGLPLYIHRCNFTIIDSNLIEK